MQKAISYRHNFIFVDLLRNIGNILRSGVLAWWFWGAVHLFYLNNMRNRIVVMIQWFWAYFTFKNMTRLITNDESCIRDNEKSS